MTPRFSVWWPRELHSSLAAPDAFTMSFCLKQSRKATESGPIAAQWLFYDAATTAESVLAQTSQSLVLCVADPTILLNPFGLHRLTETAEKSASTIGPAFSDGRPPQIVRLPFPYWDLPTYWEVAQHLAAQTDEVAPRVSVLDGRCFLTPREVLEAASRAAPSAKVTDLLLTVVGSGGLVDAGAFFHVFGPTHDRPREDLAALVPSHVHKILDVGCATGLYGKTLRQSRSSLYLVGVEPDPQQARAAAHCYDRIYEQSFEQAVIEDGPFDLVNCGDVLEHLVDPWTSLAKIRTLLRPQGFLVLSVPHIGHWTVVRALLQGIWTYVPEGLLSRGHLRWFTEESLREALVEAGFIIDVFHRRRPEPTPQGRAFLESLKALRGVEVHEESLCTDGFLVRARTAP